MPKLPIALVLLVTLSVRDEAQTTYSKAEERMVQYVNNGLAYAIKYDSLQRIPAVLDSCRRFLDAFPNSFARGNVFGSMLQMTSLISRDTVVVFPLIDSVLSYDKTPVTKMGIAQLLIEREIDPLRGASMLEEVLPYLTAQYHRYKSRLLLAQVEQSRGEFSRAAVNLKSALAIDSVRLDAWYAYLGYCQMIEDEVGASVASHKIWEIQSRNRAQYFKYVEQNSYTGKSVLEMTPTDLNGHSVPLSQFSSRVMVIQFFNFWCSIPGKELPTIGRFIKEFPQVKFVFLNFDDTPEELRERYFTRPSLRFLKDQTVVFPDSSVLGNLGNSGGMGEILVVDKHGMIRYSFPGVTKGYNAVLRAKLRQLLKEH